MHSNELKVFIPKTQSYFYSDITVVKGEAKITDEYKDAITNPFLIIEVLSERTESYDRGDTFQAYRSVESIQEYVLVSQNKPLIEAFTRNTDNTWTLTEARGEGSLIKLRSLDLDLSLADVYAKVKFSS